MANRDLMLRILGDASGYERATNRASASSKQLGTHVSNLEGPIKKTHTALLGMAAGMVGAGGLVIGFESAISAARKYQDAMEQVRTQAGASQKEVTKMSAALLNLGPAVGQTPENLAKGLYHVESAGLRGAKALSVLKTAAQGAAVGHADLESVTNALVAAQKSGIKGVENMRGAMGSLNAIVGVGNMRMEDLAGALSTGILPAARGVGLGLKDVGAALATMTDAGVPAEAASTRLRMTFSLMAAPTNAATKALKLIGLSQTELGQSMRDNGLIPTLELLKSKLQASGASAEEQAIIISRAFGGGRTGSTIVTLLQQLDNVKTKFKDIGAGASGFGDKWKAEQQTAQFASERFHAALSALQITVANALMPSLTAGLKHLSDWIVKLNDSGKAARYAHDGAEVLKTVIHDATPVVKGGAEAFKSLADALGGDKKAVEALAAAFVAVKLTGVLGGVSTKAGGAASNVGLLSSRLKMLGAIGAITVEIDVIRKFIKDPSNKGHSFVQDLALLGPTIAVGAYEGLFGGGGGAKGGSGGVPGSTPQTGGSGGLHGKSQGAAIAAVAATQIGIAYQWGGPAILGQHTDCSGLAQAVLAKNGISVGRTTYEQWGQGRAVMPGDLQAGDLVFFHMGPRGPEHVGVYIGDDQFIEDPHTGASVRVSKLSTYPGFVGARRYTAVGASTATAPVPNDTSGASGGDTGILNKLTKPKKAKKPKKPPVLTGTNLLSKGVQLALAKASGTSGTADDLSALEAAHAELVKLPQTVAVAKELASVEKQIHSIQQTDLKKHLAVQSAEWKKNAADVKASLKAEDVAWKAHVAQLQTVADNAKQKLQAIWSAAGNTIATDFNKTTTAVLTRMRKDYSTALAEFDKETRTGLAALAAPNQTLEEKALADFITSRQVTQNGVNDAKRQADLIAAQSSLGALQGIGVGGMDASGNIVTQGQIDTATANVAAAQDAINQAALDVQQAGLQTAADASRTAANAAAQTAQDNYQQQRDGLRAHMEDQEQILEDGYSNQRDIEKTNLDNWLAYQQQQLDAGLGSWQDFYTQLAALATAYGFDPSGFNGASGVDDAAKRAAVAAGNGFTPFAAGSWKGFVDANGVPASAGFYGFDANGKWTGPGLADGGRVLKTGLAVVHEGEMYSGVNGGAGWGGGLTVNVNGDVYGVDNLVDKIHAGLLRKQQAGPGLGFKGG